eukprot:12081165-Alexandrium_andersonii.AAC.1
MSASLVGSEMCIRDRSPPLVFSYKHMGGILTATGGPGLEIDARCSALVSAIGPIRKGVLACRQLEMPTRTGLLDAV